MSLTFIQHTHFSLRPRLNIPSIRQVCRRSYRTLVTASMSDRKMLHGVIRVGDLDETKKFLEAVGLKSLRERDVPDDKFSNAFYGFGPEQHGEHFSLELTYNYGVKSYDLGNGFGYFGVAVPDASVTVDRVRGAGFNVASDASSEGSTKTALVESPTGYHFKLIEGKRRDPLCQVMLRTSNLDKSVEFYEAMGMKVLRKEQGDKTTSAILGFGSEEDSTVLVLTATEGESEYSKGDGYGQIAVSCPDVYDAAEQFKERGIEVTRDPGPVPGIGTKICAVEDPDGWKTVMVDENDFEKEFE